MVEFFVFSHFTVIHKPNKDIMVLKMFACVSYDEFFCQINWSNCQDGISNWFRHIIKHANWVFNKIDNYQFIVQALILTFERNAGIKWALNASNNDICFCFHFAATIRKFAAKRNESNSSTHQHQDRGSFAVETLCIVMKRAKKVQSNVSSAVI